MKNKTLANWLLGSFGLAFITAIFFTGTDIESGLYGLSGTGIMVFSLWTIFRLFSMKKDLILTFIYGVVLSIYVTLTTVESGASDIFAFGLVIATIFSAVRLYKIPDPATNYEMNPQ